MEPTGHLTNHAAEVPNFPRLSDRLLELTAREWEVLTALANDLTSAEIAEKLNLTEKSVENYRTRIGHKLNLNGVNKLARFARKHAVELHLWHERHYLR